MLFVINWRCLCTTNIIESPHSGVRMRTRRVNNWNGGKMVLSWETAAFLETVKYFKTIGGYKQLWMLKSYLDDLEKDKALAEKRKAGRKKPDRNRWRRQQPFLEWQWT